MAPETVVPAEEVHELLKGIVEPGEAAAQVSMIFIDIVEQGIKLVILVYDSPEICTQMSAVLGISLCGLMKAPSRLYEMMQMLFLGPAQLARLFHPFMEMVSRLGKLVRGTCNAVALVVIVVLSRTGIC